LIQNKGTPPQNLSTETAKSGDSRSPLSKKKHGVTVVQKDGDISQGFGDMEQLHNHNQKFRSLPPQMDYSLEPAYQRMNEFQQHLEVYPNSVHCQQCKNHPFGFPNAHELSQHQNLYHGAFRKHYICVEPVNGTHADYPLMTPLSECKSCNSQKEYETSYDAKAHLCGAHFRPRKVGMAKEEKMRVERQERNAQYWVPMDELRRWVREILVVDDEDEELESKSHVTVNGNTNEHFLEDEPFKPIQTSSTSSRESSKYMKYFDFAAAAISDIDSSSADMHVASTCSQAFNPEIDSFPMMDVSVAHDNIFETCGALSMQQEFGMDTTTFQENYHLNSAFPEQMATGVLVDLPEAYPWSLDNDAWNGTRESVTGRLEPTGVEAYGHNYLQDFSSALSFPVDDRYLNSVNSRSS
jgi:hypothetical protein